MLLAFFIILLVCIFTGHWALGFFLMLIGCVLIGGSNVKTRL